MAHSRADISRLVAPNVPEPVLALLWPAFIEGAGPRH
jgi:hypothetical protein